MITRYRRVLLPLLLLLCPAILFSLFINPAATQTTIHPNQIRAGTWTQNFTHTGTETFTGSTTTITALDGCQHVNASQTFTAALAAASTPGCIEVDPGTYTVSANATIPTNVTLRSFSGGLLSIATSVTLTINGPIVAPPSQIFVYVGTGVVALGGNATASGVYVTWFPGSDIGAQINAAYTASPGSALTRLLIPPKSDNTCYSFSTGILFTTANKYPILQGPGGGSNGTTTFSNCLNYTPTSGVAIEEGYVATNSTAFTQQHGIRDLILWNNGCVTTAGCGGSAFGIDSQNSGWGNSNAVMENVAVIGFAFAYNNSNLQNVAGVTWINPLWEFNGVAWTNGNNTDNVILGGLCTGNQSCIQSTATVGGEYIINGLTAGCCNNGPTFDFTRSTTKVTATFTAVHFEDTAVGNSTNAHFISGLCSCRIYGGQMETDQLTGSQDWFVSIAAGGALEIHGLDLFSAGRNFTGGQAFLLNTTARGNIQITNNNVAAITPICGGAGCASSIVAQIAPSTNATSTAPTPTLAQTSQKAETSAADANVLTFTPPALAGSYRACVAISVSSATSGVISWTLSWTDSNGNAQANIAQDLFQDGTAAPATTFTTSAAGNYHFCRELDVNNAAASIIVKWVGGGTTAAKMSATVERLI